jgi:hypothetical protein
MEFTEILRMMVGLAPVTSTVIRWPAPATDVKITARVSNVYSFKEAQDLAIQMAKRVDYPARPVGFPKRIGQRWVFSIRVRCPRSHAPALARQMGELVRRPLEYSMHVEKA